MLTTVFGEAIVKEAMRWAGLDCHENNKQYGVKSSKEGSNYVVCDKSTNPTEIVTWATSNYKKAQIPWCAAFAYEVVSRAAKNVGQELPFAKNARSMQSVGSWAGLNSYGAKTDRNPVPGAVMVQNEGGKSHVGIVVEILPNGYMRTIEGNASDQVSTRDYPTKSIAKYKYTHVEEIFPELKGMAVAPEVPVSIMHVEDGEANPPQEVTDADPIIKAAPILPAYVAPPVPQKGGTVPQTPQTPQPQKPQHTGRRREWR